MIDRDCLLITCLHCGLSYEMLRFVFAILHDAFVWRSFVD